MGKINVNTWQEFMIGDLFDIHPTKHYNNNNGKALSNSQLLDSNGKNPVVVNSAYNNGVGGYSNLPCNEKGGIITFSDTTTSDAIFYQENDFIGYSHVQGMYPKKYQDKWSKYSMKFFEVVFKNRAKTLGYNYVNKFTRELANKMIVQLPVDRNKEPDWKYMETFIKNIETRTKTKQSELFKILDTDDKTSINIDNWKEFMIGDLFEVKRPSARSQSDYEKGPIPFIASGNFNNGITGYCTPKKNEILDKGNSITISPLDGSAFYQENDFLGRGGAGSAIIILYNDNLNRLRGLFLASAIRHQLTKYSYNNQLSSKVIIKQKINLPATKNNEPDWDYMETYMKNIENKVNHSLSTITQII